jgi:hypothetical protein
VPDMAGLRLQATMASSGPPPRQDTSRRGAPEPAIPRGIQPGPVQRQASFELKQYGHAVADRMMQRVRRSH